MKISRRLELPPDIELRLRQESPEISKELQEEVVLDIFRRGKISHHELSRVLGLDRIETDVYLNEHRVFEGSLTNKDLEADYQTLNNLQRDIS